MESSVGELEHSHMPLHPPVLYRAAVLHYDLRVQHGITSVPDGATAQQRDTAYELNDNWSLGPVSLASTWDDAGASDTGVYSSLTPLL